MDKFPCAQVKKLLIRLLVMGLIVVLAVLVASNVYLRSAQRKTAKYEDMPQGIALCNTGSSHGMRAFQYKETPYTAFNFAMSSQSIQYDYNLLDYYKDNLAPGAVVLVNLSYFTFWNDEMDSIDFDNKNLRYLSILDVDHMRMRSPMDYYISKYFSIIQLADRRIRSVFKSPSSMNGVADQDDEAGDGDAAARTEEDGYNRARYHMRSIYGKDGGMLPCREDNLQALDDILALCRDQGLRAVLITTPFMDIYSKWFDEEFLAAYEEVIARYEEKYGVPYLDYSKDAWFLSDPGLFLNEDHLNLEGAKQFTGMVVEQLEAMGLLPADRT